MHGSDVHDFSTGYTAAWCSQNAASVAEFYAESGSLTINGGPPSVGRTAITASAQGFMSAFPDMVVAMDRITIHGNHAVYHWTLAGTNCGPSGTGMVVKISGREEWTLGADGLVVKSFGYYDAAEYARQLKHGYDG